jgi:hypothetical protein
MFLLVTRRRQNEEGVYMMWWNEGLSSMYLSFEFICWCFGFQPYYPQPSQVGNDYVGADTPSGCKIEKEGRYQQVYNMTFVFNEHMEKHLISTFLRFPEDLDLYESIPFTGEMHNVSITLFTHNMMIFRDHWLRAVEDSPEDMPMNAVCSTWTLNPDRFNPSITFQFLKNGQVFCGHTIPHEHPHVLWHMPPVIRFKIKDVKPHSLQGRGHQHLYNDFPTLYAPRPKKEGVVANFSKRKADPPLVALERSPFGPYADPWSVIRPFSSYDPEIPFDPRVPLNHFYLDPTAYTVNHLNNGMFIDFEVKPSIISPTFNGLFTRSDLQPFQQIGAYTGKFYELNHAIDKKHSAGLTEAQQNYTVSGDFDGDARQRAWAIVSVPGYWETNAISKSNNNSLNPNAFMLDNFLYAGPRGINADEEIFWDYGPDYTWKRGQTQTEQIQNDEEAESWSMVPPLSEQDKADGYKYKHDPMTYVRMDLRYGDWSQMLPKKAATQEIPDIPKVVDW